MNYESVNQTIVNFIQAELLGFNGYVLGISGGIDSALTLALTIQAVDKEKVHCILMPFWENENLKDGIEIVHQFGVPYSIINIRNIYDAFYNTGLLWHNGTKENLMARIRMCLLYAYANEHNYKVLGTCNMSEIMTGFFTKGGDGLSDLEPIGELLKREVYGLGNFYNSVLCPRHDYPQIPSQIFTKRPTADLTPGVCDEDILGEYSVLDDVLTKIYLNGKTPATPDEVRISKIMEATEHKRTLAPIALVRWDENIE
jgi:NAD+ synthase